MLCGYDKGIFFFGHNQFLKKVGLAVFFTRGRLGGARQTSLDSRYVRQETTQETTQETITPFCPNNNTYMNPLEQENVYGVHLTASNTVEVETEVVDGCGSLHFVVTLEVVKDTTMREASDTNKITVHRKYALLMERLLQRRHGRTGTPLTTKKKGSTWSLSCKNVWTSTTRMECHI